MLYKSVFFRVHREHLADVTVSSQQLGMFDLAIKVFVVWVPSKFGVIVTSKFDVFDAIFSKTSGHLPRLQTELYKQNMLCFVMNVVIVALHRKQRNDALFEQRLTLLFCLFLGHARQSRITPLSPQTMFLA